MQRETFFKRAIQTPAGPLDVEAAINYDDSTFGTAIETATPWTISIGDGQRDIGRLVGFEGDGRTLIALHQLKPDPSAGRVVDITVFRAGDELRAGRLDEAVFGAFERWLLKRGWRGNIVKKLYFMNAESVVPIRRFWIGLGFELAPGEEGKWDEHAVKRWR